MHYPDWPRQTGVRHMTGWPLARALDFGLVRIAPATWRYQHQLAGFWRCYLNRQHGAWLRTTAETIPVPANSFFAIPPWHDHACGCEQAIDHAFVHIDLPSVGRTFCEEHWPRPLCIEVPGWSCERMREVLEGLLATKPDDTVIRCLVDSFAGAFAAAVFALIPPAPRRRSAQLGDLPEDLQLVCSYIDAHFADDLPIARLAELLRVSEGHLSRRFRKHLATSPTRYIMRRRVVRAIWLLTNTDESVDTVAELSGFHQRSYFSRTFKRFTGRAPRDYRRRG